MQLPTTTSDVSDGDKFHVKPSTYLKSFRTSHPNKTPNTSPSLPSSRQRIEIEFTLQRRATVIQNGLSFCVVRRYIVGCVLFLFVWPTFSIRTSDEILLISLWRIVENRAPIANRNSRKFCVTVEKLFLSLFSVGVLLSLWVSIGGGFFPGTWIVFGRRVHFPHLHRT